MKKVIGTVLAIILFAGGYAHNCAFGGMVLLDDFNRADSLLGSPWTVQSGSVNIVNNAARGSSTALATYDGITSSALEADVQTNGSSVQYVGLVLGYADINNNLFMKVQSQNNIGTFDKAAFYYGNNYSAGSWGLGFFDLDTPFAKAHMRVEQLGNAVTMTFSNIDGGVGIQTYTSTGAAITGGTGVGISGYAGGAQIDNFSADTTVVPVPSAFFLGSLGLGFAGRKLRRRKTT